MSLRDFYKSHYEREMVRKTDLTTALSVPVGVVSLLVGALVLMAKELHRPLSNSEQAVVCAIGASGVASFVCAYYLVRSLHNFAYGYVATPLEIQNYKTELTAFHEATGQSAVDAKHLAEEETLDYIDSEYAKYADRNSKNNDIKSTFLHQANGAMIGAVLFGSIAGGTFVYNAVSTPPTVSKFELVNLQEISKMLANQNAASSPPPPPPPAVRPEPPPGRVLKEDHRPPRPPPPPPRR